MTAWSDQVALVTGGARGIGRATVLLLAKRGAAVCVNYTAHARAAEELVTEITTLSGRPLRRLQTSPSPPRWRRWSPERKKS